MMKLTSACCLVVLASLVSLAYIECKETSKDVQFGYKQDAELDCSELNGDVEFYKVINDTDELVTESANIHIKDKKAKLIDLRSHLITPNYVCKDKSGNQIKFVKQILPFLVKPEKPSLTITQGGYTDQIVCRVLYGEDKENGKWTWYKDNVAIDSDEKIKIDTKDFDTKIIIQKVEQENRGHYNCTYTNKYGEHTESIILRVKDPLAALWPFLAIIAEVIILCLIILIYEKKCVKKPNQEDDNEQAATLLNRDGANSDLKKRTAKA